MRKLNEILPTVSIVIPCYNNDSFVAAAIESALGQTYPNVEVVIVNDGSTDRSAAVINEYDDRAKVIHQENAGACVARNRGLAEAKGEWVKFLDADDVLNADCVALQLRKAESRNIVVFGDCELIDEDGRSSPHPPHTETSGLEEGSLASLDTFLMSPVLISTTLFPRRILIEHKGFNANVRRGQEHELHLRLFLKGIDFEYHPQVCFQYRQHLSPSRLSVARRRESFFNDFEQFEQLVRWTEEGPRRADARRNQLALGRTAWRIARRRLRYGERDRAALFFAEAIRLGGYDAIYGQTFYRFLARWTSPFFAEHVSGLANRLRGRKVEKDQQ